MFVFMVSSAERRSAPSGTRAIARTLVNLSEPTAGAFQLSSSTVGFLQASRETRANPNNVTQDVFVIRIFMAWGKGSGAEGPRDLFSARGHRKTNSGGSCRDGDG